MPQGRLIGPAQRLESAQPQGRHLMADKAAGRPRDGEGDAGPLIGRDHGGLRGHGRDPPPAADGDRPPAPTEQPQLIRRRPERVGKGGGIVIPAQGKHIRTIGRAHGARDDADGVARRGLDRYGHAAPP